MVVAARVWTLDIGASVVMDSADGGCHGALMTVDGLGSSAELGPSDDAGRLDELLLGAIARSGRSSSRT